MPLNTMAATWKLWKAMRCRRPSLVYHSMSLLQRAKAFWGGVWVYCLVTLVWVYFPVALDRLVTS